MNFSELLPLGSVVILHNAVKKIVIIGYMPIKRNTNGEETIYDYVGVPYPEGYMTQESLLLFCHDKIDTVIFDGYANEERSLFVNMIRKLVDKTNEVVGAVEQEVQYKNRT